EAFIGQTYSQAPDLLKLQALSPPGAKTKKERMLLLKGGKGWIRLDGETILLDAKDLGQLQRARHADKVAGLVALLDDKRFGLSTVGDAKVKGQDTVEIEVKYPWQPDIRLFFDKETGLLAKTWQKFSDSPDGGDKFIVHEDYFSQYRVLDPVTAEREL